MEIQEIISHLTSNFGNFDITKVTEVLKGIDLKNFDLSQIISKLHAEGLLDKAHPSGESGDILDSLKDKAGDILGGIFGK